jgi:sugar transferase (PEP-CTERM system associated)
MKRSSANATSPNGIITGSYGGVLTDLQPREMKKNSPKDSLSLPAAGVENKNEMTAGISLGYPRQRVLLFIGDLLFIILADLFSAWIRFGIPINALAFYTRACTVTLFVYPATLYIFDLYNMERPFRPWERTYRSALAVILAGALSMIIFYFLPHGRYGRGIMALQMVVAWVLLTGWRWAYSVLFQSTVRKIPALILGAGPCGKAIYELLISPFSPYEVKGFLDDDPTKLGTMRSTRVIGTCKQLKEISNLVGAEAAILAIPENRSSELIRHILDAKLEGIQIREMANVYEELTGRIPIQYIVDQWLLFADGFYLLHKDYVQKLKRVLDLSLSALFLIFAAPLIALAALAVRIDSPGPIFYKQERVGKGHRTFNIYKFRSMRDNAEALGAQWALEKDTRVTRVGRYLRLSHIDEIPQMWNVFKGDMSLVGPRPERPEFVRLLEDKVPYYFARHSVRPGITGWAQVNYRYGASIEDAACKLESDLYYIKNMSVFLDIKIMLRTIGVVFLADGAR